MEKLSFIPVMGTEEKILAQDRYEGHVYFATDTGRIYLDSENESKLLMGGSSGIHYGQHVHIDTPAEEQENFEFLLSEIEDTGSSPNEDDLILNIPDGCFYRIIEIEETEEETILHVKKLTIAGSGTGSGGGGGQIGGSGGISWITTSPATAIYNKDFAIEFNLTAIDSMNQPTEGHEYVLKAERRESGNPTTIVAQGSLNQGYNAIEIGKFLNEVGTWRVRIEANLEIGGTAPITYNKTFTVTVTTISLKWDYDQSKAHNAEDNFVFSDWVFNGTGEEKKLHIVFDDYNTLEPVRLPNNLTSLNYSINPLSVGLTHGVHKVKIYGSLEINGETITTDPIYKNIIFYEKDKETTLISCNLFDTNLTQYTTVAIPIVIYSPKNSESGSATIVLMEEDKEVATWTNRKNEVVYEWLYTPLNSGENITLTVKCDNEEAILVVNVASLNIDNEEISGYSFRFKTSEMADNEAIQNWAAANGTVFSEDFNWNSGGIHSEVDEKGYNRQYLLIKKGDYVDMNVKPFMNSASASGLSMKIIFKTDNCQDYDAQFLTCYEDRELIRYDVTQELDLEIPSGTILSYSGRVNIVDSVPTLDLTVGGTVTYDSTDIANVLEVLNKKYFSYNEEIYYFSYRLDANDDNAIVISIYPTYITNLGVGIKMRAQEAELSCTSASITVPYYEESYIELEFDIAKNKTETGFRGRYIKPWLDGVPCGVVLYDNSDTINQNTAKTIRIGSAECDVYLYLLKIYNKSLSDEEHLENFIADAPNGQEMLDRFNRNNILNTELTQQYQTPIIDYTKLSEKNPNCHVHLYSIERMTKNKKDPVGVYSYSQYLNGDRILKTTDPIGITEGKRSNNLTEEERNKCPARVKVQGTSSAAYGLAAFNMDTDFIQTNLKNEENCSLIDINNNPLPDGWSMDEQAIPCTYFCTKVNVASAEGANNALNQEWYNYHQPYIGAARQRNYDEYGNLKEGPLYRDTMQFQPGVVFIKDWNQNTNQAIGVENNLFKELGSGYTDAPFYKMYSIGCMGNSKDNVHVFHTDTECCVENNDNQLPGQWMTIAPGAYTYKDSQGNEKTIYVDLEDIEADNTTTIPDTGDKISNRILWENALDDVYGFRYPDGIEDVKKFTDENGSEINPKTGNKYSDDMIEGWFRFVYWMSRNDPMPKYESLEILSEEDFVKYKKTHLTLYSKQTIDNDDIEYVAMENYDNSLNEYYYETVHVHGPDGKKLPEPVKFNPYTFKGDEYSKTLAGFTESSYSGATYTHDTQNYRVAKMLSECEDYLTMDSVVYHYLFIERHTMIDNVAKNTFWSSADYKHWDLTKDYDNDTADGNDNQGKLTLTYGYEIGDTKNGSSVFNAGHSVWLHFIRNLPLVCRYMYQQLETKTKPWEADSYLQEFKTWQQAIPERCWIEDYYRKYIRPWEVYNDSGFLPRMEGGLKTHQREQYERYQEDYLSSKYQTNQSSNLELRPKTGENDIDVSITFELYADGYLNMAAGSGHNINKTFRMKRNEPFIWNDRVNFNDATFYIYNPKNLQTIGNQERENDSFAIFNTSTLGGLSECKKLRKFVFSSKKDSAHTNTQLSGFDVSGAKMLQELHACYLYFAGGNSIGLDLSSNESLVFVDGRNSNFSIITIADGAPLKELYLNSPSQLILSNLSDFETYEAEYGSLMKIELNNIDNSIVNSKVLVTNALNSSTVFSEYKLYNVNWIIDDSSEINITNNTIPILDKLIALYEDQLKTVNLPTDLTGSLTITENAYNTSNSLSIYEKYSDKTIYPNLDIKFLGENAKLYTINVIDGNNLTIWSRKAKPSSTLSETFFIGEDDYTPSFGALDLSKITKMDTNENTYTKTGTWNIYNADTGELIAARVESDENGYPLYNEAINSNITIEHYFEENIRYYNLKFYDSDRQTVLVEFKGDGNETGYGGITYKTLLGEVLEKILVIPYKDDNGLSLKSTYNHIGYHYIQDSVSALPNTYQIINDSSFYPVFELIEDITSIKPHYEYFDYEIVTRDESTISSNHIENPQIYTGYSLKPKTGINLSGKVVLPLVHSDGTPIIEITGFNNQKKITHIFFEKKTVSHGLIVAGNCFQDLENLKYFEFNDNINILQNNSLRKINLDASLYNGVIILGKKLKFIGSRGINQAFVTNTTSHLSNKAFYFPSSLNFIGDSGVTNNDGLVDYEIVIGGPKYGSLSNLNLGSGQERITNNIDAMYTKITFYTTKYKTKYDEAVIAAFIRKDAYEDSSPEFAFLTSI